MLHNKMAWKSSKNDHQGFTIVPVTRLNSVLFSHGNIKYNTCSSFEYVFINTAGTICLGCSICVHSKCCWITLTYQSLCHCSVVLTWPRFTSYSLLHCPEQKHNCVHGRFALTQLHLLVHSFLHPHFNNSWQPLAASGRVDQHGAHGESSFTLSQAHISGDGTLGLLTSDCPQICSAW